jgi:hypothetical protein
VIVITSGGYDMRLSDADRDPSDDARFFLNGDRIVVRNSQDQKVAEAFKGGRMVIRRQGTRCIISIEALLKALRRLGDSNNN